MSRKRANMATSQEMSRLIEDASRYISIGCYADAKYMLEEYLKHVPKDSRNADGSYSYTFEDIAEYYLALNKFQGGPKLRWSKYKTSEAYFLLSTIALEEGNVQTASLMLEQSLSFNPINAYARMQKAEIQRRYQDWDAMLDCLSEAYEYICTEEGIAKFFRMYASCYEVCGQDEIAICLYSLSLVYEKSTIAADAVFALQDLTGYTMENFSMSDRMRLLRNYDLPLSVSRDNLNILGRLMRDDKIHQKYPEEMKKIVQRFTVLSSAYDMGY
jgi:tetratricopeptide (TPR) repeat protein